MSAPEGKIHSVAEVSRLVKRQIEGAFPPIWVAGEVSSLSRPASGHIYFSLKEGRDVLAAVCWRGTAPRVVPKLTEGGEVLVFGRLTSYGGSSKYQIVVESAEPRGAGAMMLAFEELKKKLEAEGLFAPERKRPLPMLPRRVGVVTSSSGAAIRDILRTIDDRCPSMRVLLAPARVQGDGAAAEIAAGIAALGACQDVDVIIVGRGGGSVEDLWAFNEEQVARAIHAAPVPVISAVGHEVDFTISDFVADVRALTPTNAGELAVPDEAELRRAMGDLAMRSRTAIMRMVENTAARLDAIESSYALRAPAERLEPLAQRLDEIERRLLPLVGAIPAEARRKIEATAGALQALNPRRVLARGYSITTDGEGRPIRSWREVAEGDRVTTRLAEGRIVSKVEDAKEGG